MRGLHGPSGLLNSCSASWIPNVGIDGTYEEERETGHMSSPPNRLLLIDSYVMGSIRCLYMWRHCLDDDHAVFSPPPRVACACYLLVTARSDGCIR